MEGGGVGALYCAPSRTSPVGVWVCLGSWADDGRGFLVVS